MYTVLRQSVSLAYLKFNTFGVLDVVLLKIGHCLSRGSTFLHSSGILLPGFALLIVHSLPSRNDA